MNNPYIEGAEADAFDFGYQQGRADKYQEITLEYMLLTEEQVAEIRADAMDEFIQKYVNRVIKEYGSEFITDDNFAIQIAEQLKEQNNESTYT